MWTSGLEWISLPFIVLRSEGCHLQAGNIQSLGEFYFKPGLHVGSAPVVRVKTSHWSRLSGHCALIGWVHSSATPALLCHIEPAQDISCLTLCLYGIRMGGFHAGKGSITGSGVSNMMIPPIMDYFCACPPIIAYLCESRTSTVLHSACSSPQLYCGPLYHQ